MSQQANGTAMSETTARRRKEWTCFANEYDEDEATIFYGSTAAQARLRTQEAIQEAGWSQSLIGIRVRRAKHEDVLLPMPHPMLEELSDKETHMIGHAYGIWSENAGYRSHYVTSSEHKEMNALVEKGIFEPEKESRELAGKGNRAFFLAKLGQDIALSLVPTYRGEK